MSGITSGIGLISGIDTAKLIEQLMAIEARPVQNLQRRSTNLDTQRAAILELSGKLLALQESVKDFDDPSFFQRFSVKSSNEAIATATASRSATPGSHTFRVHSLVTNHSLISRGYADADRTPVGTGRITIEVGRGRVDRGTPLAALNGGEGVRRGTITITDRSGVSADVDLSKAFTVEDILAAINTQTRVGVRARVTGLAENGATGDRIVIEDTSGGSGHLIIADKPGSFTARDLGLAANAAGARIDGHDLVRLTPATLLSALNDGNGVGRQAIGSTLDDLTFTTSFGTFGVALTDVLRPSTDLRALNSGNGVRLGRIRITDRNHKSVEIDLADPNQAPVRTAEDVRRRINDSATAAGVSVSIAMANSAFQLTDNTNAGGTTAGHFIVEDVQGFAAADLGIAADVESNAIRGRDVYRVASVGDVINAINYAAGNADFVRARISDDGKGITLAAQGLGNNVTVSAGQGSTTAADLGLAGAAFSADGGPFQTRRLVGGLNTVLLRSLNGGRGVGAGSVALTDGQGQSTTIDFSQAATLQDVVDLINADAATSVTAAINSTGSGIVLSDGSRGTGPLVVADVGGTLAADLGIAGTFDGATGARADSGNLQLQYISRQSKLTDINAAIAGSLGTVRITDSAGVVHSVVLASNLKTVGEVLDVINLQTSGAVEARINDTGDGLLLVDRAGGTAALKVEDQEGGRAAADLRLAGTARSGEAFIDGTLETRIDIGAADTLRDIAAKLNAAGGLLSASVVNAGGAVNPFSLTVTSSVSGRPGELLLVGEGLDLGLETLSQARDAVVTLGGAGASPLVVSSPTNTLEGVVEGVSLQLLGAGDEDVTVTVAQDIDALVERVQTFVDRYNDAQAQIDEAISFNADTLERGPLFGDATVNLVRERLTRLPARTFQGAGSSLNRLSGIGVRFSGNRLTFDKEQFREVYADSPEQVERLFTAEGTGFGAVVQSAFDDLTRDGDGIIARKEQLLQDQKDLLAEQIGRLNVLLDAKRARLEAQFAALESSLAALQDQQNSLAALSQLGTGG
ncbi:MAG: flagellar filament capping protein FliD [Planctomycetes bacterium]|nr:flagellar filament capping protein FliD [Planctomycetota bacterium]